METFTVNDNTGVATSTITFGEFYTQFKAGKAFIFKIIGLVIEGVGELSAELIPTGIMVPEDGSSRVIFLNYFDGNTEQPTLIAATAASDNDYIAIELN